MTLGEMIRAKREEQEMTQQALADILFVTRQTVSRWESGSRCPDLILAKKLADVFNISLDELASGTVADTCTPAKSAIPDSKKLSLAVFLLTLSVWLLLLGSKATVLVVFSVVLAFTACFLFISGFWGDHTND